MRAARKVPQSTCAAVSGSTEEPPATPPSHPDRLALRLLWYRLLRMIRKLGHDHPLPSQRIADNCRAATERMSSRDCQHRVRMRPPPPTAATIGAGG